MALSGIVPTDMLFAKWRVSIELGLLLPEEEAIPSPPKEKKAGGREGRKAQSSSDRTPGEFCSERHYFHLGWSSVAPGIYFGLKETPESSCCLWFLLFRI